jgi:hypothetical protein
LLRSLLKPEYCELSSHNLHKKCEEIFNSFAKGFKQQSPVSRADYTQIVWVSGVV